MSSAKSKFVFMAGAIASGKTTLARKIAAESNAVLFSIDEWVGKVGHPVIGFKEYDRYYHPCWELISTLSREFLKRGVSVVLDFGGNSPKERARTRTIFGDLSCDHALYFLNTPPEVCAARFKKRNENPETEIREESLREAEKAGVKNTFVPLTSEEDFNLIEVTNG